MNRAEEVRNAVIVLLQPLLAREGLILVECTVALSRGSLKLDLAVDSDDAPADGVHGLTVGEYSRLTRYLEDLLEAEMPELGEFGLTVGSPGVQRRLQSDLELAWGVGKLVEVRLQRGGGRLYGRLTAYDDESLTLGKVEGHIPGQAGLSPGEPSEASYAPGESPEAARGRIERADVALVRLHFDFPGAKAKPLGKRLKR